MRRTGQQPMRGRGQGYGYQPPKQSGVYRGGGGMSVGMSDDSLNIALIVLTIALGIVAQIVCGIVYSIFLYSMPRPLLIGIMFLILAVTLAVVVSLFSRARGQYGDDVLEDFLPFGGNPFLTLGSLVLAIALLAVLFQFLYGLGGVTKQEPPTSYIFVIDDSGSMEQNDPNQLRYSAIETILEQQDDTFPYMIYGFSDECAIVRDMGEKSLGIGEIPSESYGGTSILGSVEKVYSDYEQKVWDGGANPKVIMLTDGDATDMKSPRAITKDLGKYRKAGISISTVGLGAVDERLMEKLARETGGVFISVDDASKLSDAMGKAAVLQSDRDLVNTRFSEGLDILHAIMRIVFLFILGILLSLLAYAAYGDEESSTLTVLSGAIAALLGSLLMELGTSVFMWGETAMWRIMWVLFALTIALKHSKFIRQTGVTVAGAGGSGMGPGRGF